MFIPNVNMSFWGEGKLRSQEAWPAISSSCLHNLPILQVAVGLANLAAAAIEGYVPD